jgi:GxxExxY protein
MPRHAELTRCVIGFAIEVHRPVGLGLLESVYRECLADETEQAGIPFRREATVPVVSTNKRLPL